MNQYHKCLVTDPMTKNHHNQHSKSKCDYSLGKIVLVKVNKNFLLEYT